MITCTDLDYKLTKAIKQGKTTLTPDFIDLSTWIESEYHVRVLNLVYDVIPEQQRRPRLNVIFEFEEDALKFREIRLGNFDSDKQRAIAGKFEELVIGQQQNPSQKYDPDKTHYSATNLLVVFSAFEPIAREDAVSSIPEAYVVKLKHDLGNDDLWEISRAFSTTTFFVYTDKQVKQYENSQARTQWTQQYFDLLDRYNEFGYFKRDTFSIRLDSKQNFETNYKGNWLYYYR